jgi:hypothetical protein
MSIYSIKKKSKKKKNAHTYGWICSIVHVRMRDLCIYVHFTSSSMANLNTYAYAICEQFSFTFARLASRLIYLVSVRVVYLSVVLFV